LVSDFCRAHLDDGRWLSAYLAGTRCLAQWFGFKAVLMQQLK
jgi:hypothetical protein